MSAQRPFSVSQSSLACVAPQAPYGVEAVVYVKVERSAE